MWLIAAILLFAVEVWIATKGAGLPFVRGELGDFLVVILMYAAAKAVRPGLPRSPLALAIFGIAVALETAQAFGLADRLGLPRGSVARIVIGTTFQWADLAMYALGCLAVWAIDRPRKPATAGTGSSREMRP